ncbi:hypothetical protein B0H21DRAFT_89107 [Amylocystis lapponica]|nr:hypothetical protein B0H21DRAFT_89107 [Amylocystis lapponica]
MHTSGTMAPVHSKVTLIDLPNEILFQIKGHISASDLRTHVCFYKSYPRISALYAAEHDEEAFWEQACWLAGIGLKHSESPQKLSLSDYTWKRIAFDCIERDGFCEHPECGDTLLAHNAICMARCIKNGIIPYKKPLAVERSAAVAAPTINTLLESIAFKRLQSQDQDEFGLISFPNVGDVEGDAYLSCESPLSAYDSLPATLDEHPLATRSFVTFPPVTKMTFRPLIGYTIESVKRSTGLTVMDVVAALYSVIDTELEVEVVDGYLENIPDFVERNWLRNHSDSSYHLEFYREFSVAMTLRMLRTFRDILDVDNWDGLFWINTTDEGGTYGLSLKSETCSPF